MSWDGLIDKKGLVLPAEMKAGLMGRLWNRRPDVGTAATFITLAEIPNRMPRQWHIDGAALNFELDNIFSADKEISIS
jgi:hypothetical protein